MALTYANRMRSYVVGAPGTGDIVLGAAVPGYQDWTGPGFGSGTRLPYCAEDGAAWEIGYANYNAADNSISRTVLESSNGNSPLNLSASAQVFVTPHVATVLAPELHSVTIEGPISGAVLATSILDDKIGDRVLTPSSIWNTGAEAPLAYASTLRLVLRDYSNAKVTLTGNIILDNPTFAKAGQSGRIRLIQDATGSRTISYGSAWKRASADSGTLSTTANATDILYYDVIDSSTILYSIKRAVA